MTTRQKILAKQPLSLEEIRQMIEDRKEYLCLLYLSYLPFVRVEELWLVNSGMKKALRKQIKKYGLSYSEAEEVFMQPENVELIRSLIKKQAVCEKAEIAMKKLGDEDLNSLYRRKHKFFMCERFQ